MGRKLVPRYIAALDITKLKDNDLQNLVGDVKLAAATSPVVAGSPPMQASVTALVAKAGNLAQANQAVADDRQKLRLDTAAEAQHRNDVHGELRTYAALTASVAKSPADVHSAGLPAQVPRPPVNRPPTVPELMVRDADHGRA